MPDDIPLPARIFYTLTGADSPAKCKVCGGDIPHGRKCNALTGYASLCCSRSCAQLDPDHIRRAEESSFAKYGTRLPQMSDAIKAKMRKTWAEKPASLMEKANERRKKTNMLRYGVEFSSQAENAKKASRESWAARTIEEEAARQEKRKATNLVRHGAENYFNAEKARETVEAAAKTDPEYRRKISERRKATFREKYGVDCAMQMPANKEKVRTARSVKSFDEHVSKSEYVEPLFDAGYYAAHRFDELPWKCRECGREFRAKAGDQMYFPARCAECHPLHDPSSRPEKELSEFVKSVCGGDVIENDRAVIGPNELDVYVPSLKIAFEMDGLLWHSEEMGTDKNYHLSKTEKCEAAGVRLVHVSEAEWKCRRAITESRIKALFGKFDRRTYARNCEVRDVGAAESKEFQERNHIQGYTPAKVNLGLFDKGELVALMTFGKCRFDKKREWELVRFCSALGVYVAGGAGKLLAAFERKYAPESLVSYADRRWSQGGLYAKLGFTLDHASKPDYKYWNRKKGVYMPESRLKYQKHRLASLLGNFDPALSESENMKRAGFVRIYDCGNLVFVKERPQNVVSARA